MTAVPAVLRALKDTLTVALPSVLVVKGQPLQRPSDPDLIVIAYAGEGPSVEHVTSPAGLGSDRETFDVTNLISVLRGDPDVDVVIDRADELLEAVRAELTRDTTLGGAVAWAHLTSFSQTPQQVSAGALAEIELVVRATAFRVD